MEDSNEAVASKAEPPCWDELARYMEGGVEELALTEAPEIDRKVI